MGLFFRKTTKFGPFRITSSKSGIGWSYGSKLLRFGKSSTGQTYVSGGSNGLYYRQNLQNGKSKTAQIVKPRPKFSSGGLVGGIGLFLIFVSPFIALIFTSWIVFLCLISFGILFLALGWEFSSRERIQVIKERAKLQNEVYHKPEIVQPNPKIVYSEDQIEKIISDGISFENEGVYDAAIRCFEDCIKGECKSSVPYEHLISIYKKKDNIPEVKRIAIMASNKFPAKASYYKQFLLLR